jgi:23S rRNA pseudouridine2605 synthase
MRLNKFISSNTQYSRREADRIIQAGRVNIKRDVEKNPATNVPEDSQDIFLDGKKIKLKDGFTAIVYNKPKGELVTSSDPRGRKTIYHTLGGKFKGFKPVGRLDFASEGVLILSDSNEVIDLLSKSSLERLYRIKISGKITEAMISAMNEGLTLSDASAGGHEKSEIKSMEFQPFNSHQIVKNQSNYSILKVSISEGKNRELRRFFTSFGVEVLDLKRLSFGWINLNALPTGKKRFFSKDEYSELKTFLKNQKNKQKQQTKESNS